MLTKTTISKRAHTQLDAHIGARIRMRRNELNVSQQALAATLGLSFQQVQKYEKGTNRISGGRMAAIAEALQVDISFFYRGTSSDDRAPTTSVIDDFVATTAGARIARAFPRIESDGARAAIVTLIEQLAGEVLQC